MFDAGDGGRKLGFVADTVARGPGAGYVATQTRFAVDPSEAQRLIDGLKEALEKLIETDTLAAEIRLHGAPGQDVYSAVANDAIQRTAGNAPGGYSWANQQAQRALETTIENIQKALAEYQQTDSAAGDALKPKG
ncbi:hypothetical protein FHS29_004212 [Saccharothrix tamanrassetensis]|uniref:PE domain-containing protein n=1 Tax=Saccharothrix tamanrassetensis TaxID=1051531 RepID=A0A841CNG1_9PSEU|nr:hypothetical protein [Saccharothrix tamanrassetensis]MBB5957617.1 hypothetical protein [Saccharothrix tamanrassetensis]